jgi:hypothetical protein
MFFRKIHFYGVNAALIQLSTAVLCLYVVVGHAGSPTLEHLYPVGAAQGETRTVQSTGKVDPWPPKVWISESGVHFDASEKKGQWKVTVKKDAEPGPRLVRFYNGEGTSTPRYFIVSRTSDFVESEPNGRVKESNTIKSLPCLVHGKLNRRQDTDMFRVHLKQGKTFIARLDAYILGSTTDALLRILDAQGKVLDWNHDHYYLDPCIQFKTPATGYYWVQVLGFPYPATSSEQLAGGDGYVYRLFMSNGAYIRECNVSTDDSLQLIGWNLGNVNGSRITSHTWNDSIETVTGFQKQLVRATDINQEQEPNDLLENASDLSSNRRGIIHTSEDIDWYSFEATKDQWHQFELQSSRLGYPTDLVLKLYDENEKEIKSDDDNATMNDPRMDWKTPKTDKYFLKVTSLTHQGGPEQIYRLIHTIKQPDCELTVEASEFNLTPGESVEIKIGLTRKYDHKAPLSIQTSRLPAGISCAPVMAEKEAKDIKLILHATPSALPFQGELKIFAKEIDQWNHQFEAGKQTVTTSVNNGVPAGYLDQVYRKINRLWLTVLPRPVQETKKETENKENQTNS